MSRPDALPAPVSWSEAADILGNLAGDQHATWQDALHRCGVHSDDQVDQEFRRQVAALLIGMLACQRLAAQDLPTPSFQPQQGALLAMDVPVAPDR